MFVDLLLGVIAGIILYMVTYIISIKSNSELGYYAVLVVGLILEARLRSARFTNQRLMILTSMLVFIILTLYDKFIYSRARGGSFE